MKKICLTTVAFIALAGSASAADLASKSASIVSSAPIWTGFYAGLNAGYNFGTNSNINSSFWQATSVSIYDPLGYDYSSLSNTNGSIAKAGGAITQSGFIGGGQLGYNYQYQSKIILGIETDFQGSVSKGNQNIVPLFQGAGCCTINSNNINFPTTSARYNQQSYLISSVTAGVDYLGTLRARIGYLIKPTILVYATGGLAYGGAWSSISNTGAQSTYLSTSSPYPVANQVYYGNNQSNSLLVGYSAGGGLEWSILNNLSLKFEALYWNLGDVNLVSNSFAGSNHGGIRTSNNSYFRANPGLNIISENTNINYQGVIARAGVNYHFDFGKSAPVAAKF